MKSTTMSAWRRLVWITVALVAAFTAAHPSRAHAGSTASRELGQVDFVHNAYNTVDAQVLAVASSQTGIAVDLSATPNHVYVTDPGNNRVLGYSSVTALTNGAPASIVIGQPDFASSSTDYNGITPTALSEPRGVAVDSSGNVYVADSGNNRVLVFSNPFTILNATGQNSGFAATMVLGQAGDFTSYGCNVGASNPSADTLCFPEGVALDGSNNLYVADTSNNRVLEFNTPFPSGSFKANKVFGQFGNFTTNTANNSGVSKDSLNAPTGVAVDIHNNLYVADTTNNRVLEYNTPLTVTGIPGSGDTSADEVWGQGGSFGTANCNGGGVSATALCSPGKVALDASANLYIPDTSNNRVLEYNESANPPTNRTANVILGQTNSTSSSCNQGGANPSFATLCQPTSAAVDSGGNVFVVDSNNNRMVRYNAAISTDEAASVVIGQPDFVHKAENLVDPASLDLPRQIAIDASATPNHLFAADSQNSRVLGWLNAGGFANGAPADLVIGQPDFESSSCDSGGIGAATLCHPHGVAVDSGGNLYVADYGNNRVLEFNAPFAGCSGTPCVGGSANLVFGQSGFTGSTCNINGSTISASSLCTPEAVGVDSLGNLYVGDWGNNRVLEYNTPLSATSVSGSGDTTADLVFGQGATGTGTEFTTNSANNGGISAVSLDEPAGVAVDPNNNLYVADYNNSRVLEYNETVNATTPPGNVTADTVFGQLGSLSQRTCNNVALSADSLCGPAGVSVDSSDNLYVADYNNNRVLQYLTPLSSGTTASVVWGQGGNFTSNYANVGGGPSAATLYNPVSVANDAAGNLYISDYSNNRITAYAPPFPPPGAQAPPPPGSGLLSVTPVQIKFATTRLGKSRHAEVIVKNSGTVPVRITNVSASGDFQYSNSCERSLPAGQSCGIEVTFAPVTIGVRGGTLVISDDANHSPHIVDFRGRAVRRRAPQ